MAALSSRSKCCHLLAIPGRILRRGSRRLPWRKRKPILRMTMVIDKHSPKVICLCQRNQNKDNNVRTRSRFRRRPWRKVREPWVDVADTEYPKNGFSSEVGEIHEGEVDDGAGMGDKVAVGGMVVSGTSWVGNRGRIGSSIRAKVGKFPPCSVVRVSK